MCHARTETLRSHRLGGMGKCPSGLTLTNNGVADIRDSGEGEYGSRHGETPEGVDRHREESSEQGDEAVDLNDHSHDGPAQQNHKNAAKKT